MKHVNVKDVYKATWLHREDTEPPNTGSRRPLAILCIQHVKCVCVCASCSTPAARRSSPPRARPPDAARPRVTDRPTQLATA